jgi:hypothetical protein
MGDDLTAGTIGPDQQASDMLARWRERFRDPLLTILTAMLAIFLFVIAPMQAAGILAAHYFGIFFGLVLAGAILVLSRSVSAAATIVVAISLVIIATILRVRHPSVTGIYLDASAWMITGLTLCIVVGGAVFAPGGVTYHRIVGAILLYLAVGLIFAALFCFVAVAAPHAFTGVVALRDNLAVASDLIYFSFVSLTSVGYGDIAPLNPYARGLANIEAVIGQLYPATILARLVTLQFRETRVD